jgi:hypothetical protein
VKRLVAVLAIVAVAACSSLPNSGDGIVALQVFAPDSLILAVDSSVTLRAQALDIQGNTVPAVVFWRTPDTAFVTLDSVSGVLVGTHPGLARVQARVGTLASDPLTFTIDSVVATAPAGIRERP